MKTKRALMLIVALLGTFGGVVGSASPAAAHDVCNVYPNTPYFDLKIKTVYGFASASCTKRQAVILIGVDLEKLNWNNGLWEKRATSQTSYEDTYSAWWEVYTTCANAGKARFRTDGSLSALEPPQYRNDKDDEYSSPAEQDCGGYLRLIDP